MKKLHLLLMSFVAGIFISSCSNSEEPQPSPTPEVEDATYEVSLSLGGEYTNVTEVPLSRADETAPKKYYGINVYCMKNDGTESTYTNYAYGVFDNVPDMKITLLGGYKYKFECTSVTEGDDKLFVERDNYLYSPLYYNLLNLNNFITSQDNNLSEIQRGYTCIPYGSYYKYRNYPRMDRYYGELEDFVPSAGAVAKIPLKRTAFGIKIVVNGVPDGNLEWEEKKDDYNEPDLYFNCENCTGSEKIEFSQIYTFSDVYNCWKSVEPYTKDFTIKFTWTRANDYKQYFEEKITVKRNVMTTITVNLKGGANDVTIGINEDETPMENENVNINYDGGDLNDTPVDPQS